MASSAESSGHSEVFIIQHHGAPGSGLIPVCAEDFAAIESVEDLLPSSEIPSHRPDFLLVCRDGHVSDRQLYGIRIHKRVWENSVRNRGYATLKVKARATGFQLALQYVSVMYAIVVFLYTGALAYDVDSLPISEAHFLTALYRTAVNRALSTLADAAYSRILRPETRIGDAQDIKQTLHLILFPVMGKGGVGYRRRTDIRQAVIIKFAQEIWDALPDDDLAQLCGDSQVFAREMLGAVADVVRASMAERGIALDEMD